MSEHEFHRTRLRFLECTVGDHSVLGRDAQVLEDVEGRVERAMPPLGVVAHVAVPAAVFELRGQDRFAEWSQPRIAGKEVRAEPEPEAEVAEIRTLEQEREMHFFVRRHEASEQPPTGALAAG